MFNARKDEGAEERIMTKNKKSRMYEADGKTVRTWNVFKGCRSNCNYCVQREQAKRQKHKCEKCYLYEPHMHSERLTEKFKPGETVFVAAMGDIVFATHEEWGAILEVIRNFPETTFFLQSKNPQCFIRGVVYPQNIVLGTTIETNRDTYDYSDAISTDYRYEAMREINHRKYLSLEPILDFDLDILLGWIKEIAPEFVYVGYLDKLSRAKKLRLPEPKLVKVKELCWELGKFTEVRLKSMRMWWGEE